MNGTWEIIPGSIAALLYVRTPETTGDSQSVVWLGSDGAVVGRRDTHLAKTGWPQAVQDSINTWFEHVFALEHERRADLSTPSPRAVFVDNARAWTIEINPTQEN